MEIIQEQPKTKSLIKGFVMDYEISTIEVFGNKDYNFETMVFNQKGISILVEHHDNLEEATEFHHRLCSNIFENPKKYKKMNKEAQKLHDSDRISLMSRYVGWEW